MKNFTLLVLFTLLTLTSQAQNLLVTADANPSFEGSAPGNIYWWFSQANGATAATFDAVTGIAGTPDGSKCLQATVTAINANSYDVQLISVKQYYALTAGTPYTFRFWVKTDAGQSINALLQDGSYGTPIAGSYQYGQSTTTGWTQVTYNFTPTATASVRPVFQFGAATGVYYLDNIELGTTASLPVELIAFKAQENAKNKSINLNWQTADEARLKDYTVQRSADGKSFADISTVAAKNSTAKISYDFQDENPVNGVNYYRLKINEQDGSFKYSTVQSATIGGKISVAASPNPTSGAFELKSAERFEDVRIYDISGRLVSKFVGNDANQYSISNLPKGVYEVVATSKATVSVAKLVKM
jgi:Carbohydrate binding domain/Secretion system C-terminal sorting domain